MGRFIDLGKHHAHPRTETHKRANSAGGLAKDTTGGEDVAALTEILAGGVVRRATVTGAVSAASGNTLGTGIASVVSVEVADGITPLLVTTAGQTIRNPFAAAFAVGTEIGVAYTGQFYIIVTPALSDVTMATLIPVIPTVTGSKASGAALVSLLTTLATLGIIVDGTSA